MKLNSLKTLLLLFTICIWTGCEKDLEIVPKNALSTEGVFASESGADLFLNDIYVGLPNPEGAAPNGQRAGGPGFAFDNWDWMSPYNYNKFNWANTSGLIEDFAYTASQRSNPSPYNNTYPAVNFIYDIVVPRIRDTNFFIESVVDNMENYSTEWSTKRLAEAKCLRTFYYHLLWMNYGGVPLITKVLNQAEMGDEIFQPSASMEEMFTFMQKDLADAAAVLPNEVGDGHFTAGAALALKAWIELFWADTVKDPKPKAIFPADQEKAKSLYLQSAATCRKIIDSGVYGLMPTRTEAFTEENNNCREQIFAYQAESTYRKSQRTLRFGPQNPATGATGNVGQGAPSQALVDMYGMANGLPISDPDSGYNPEKPFENREPRFYEDIIYDGSIFGGHRFTFVPNAADGDIQILPDDGVRGGYYRRKGINEALTAATFGQEAVTFPFFRYAEVLLMYAEARIKAASLGGPAIDQTVINALDEVRMRPATKDDNGLPSLMTTYGGTPTLSQLQDIIWSERIVELSFEFKAYLDVRRFRKADELIQGSKEGIKWNNATGEYESFELYKMNFPGEKYYLMPIYTGWLEQNPVWMDPANQVDGRSGGQNPGW